jgi:hypothetical protein
VPPLVLLVFVVVLGIMAAATDPEAPSNQIALQYVRKVSGATAPSKANAAAFERAVDEVAAASRRLLASMVTSAPPKDRAVEAARAKARSAARFAGR